MNSKNRYPNTLWYAGLVILVTPLFGGCGREGTTTLTNFLSDLALQGFAAFLL